MTRLQAFWKFITGDSRSIEILIEETRAQRMELERLLARRRRALRAR
jgi:hypothetical protein